jgi:hypothetical protein
MESDALIVASSSIFITKDPSITLNLHKPRTQLVAQSLDVRMSSLVRLKTKIHHCFILNWHSFDRQAQSVLAPLIWSDS